MLNKTILIISPHQISDKMAGPAIRYWEFAKCLSQQAAVTLAIPNQLSPQEAQTPFEILSYSKKTLPKLIEKSDTVLIQGFLFTEYPVLQEMEQSLIIDLYDPYPLEQLALNGASTLGNELYRSTLASLLVQLIRGDFFICASSRQRDFWLGMLTAMGRVNPETYQDDKTFHNLIDVVSFGLPREAPIKSAPAIREVTKNISSADKVILWGGGIYDWLDPFTPILAIQNIIKTRRDVKLFFMGTTHPARDKVSDATVTKAVEMSKDMGLYDQHVFFNSGWIPYTERQNYLLDADIGITAHPDHIESRFSFRTRVLDYIWAGLPMVLTKGDDTSGMVNEQQLGIIVEPQNVNQMSEAILSLLSTPNYSEIYKERSQKLVDQLKWDKVIEPLMKYCASPKRALDQNFMKKHQSLRRNLSRSILKEKSLSRTAWYSLQDEGFNAFLKRTMSYLRRWVRK